MGGGGALCLLTLRRGTPAQLSLSRAFPFSIQPSGTISPEYSVKGLMMLKLKLQYFGHLIRGTDSFEKTLMLGKIEGGRRRG